ncbi:MAG TPA: hypothetical protein VFF11_04710 [Candidatus Binatia bacterium]|nr:hypothetical protein [Candidatus Binatia bacterium]
MADEKIVLDLAEIARLKELADEVENLADQDIYWDEDDSMTEADGPVGAVAAFREKLDELVREIRELRW